MRKKVFNILIIMLLFICSMLLISCEAITAQNIKNTGSAPSINGVPEMKGSSGMNGNQGMKGHISDN